MIQEERLVRRLAATVRGATLYSASHPVVQRGLAELLTLCRGSLDGAGKVSIACLDNEFVVGGSRLGASALGLNGFARMMQDRAVETITLTHGVSRDELGTFVDEFCTDREGTLAERLARTPVQHISVGQLALESEVPAPVGLATARIGYDDAVTVCRRLWDSAKVDGHADPGAVRGLADGLAKLVSQDWTSLMALTSAARFDDYTFNHMVNVSILSMALARSLDIRGPRLREFGAAALMHDIGKVNVPEEILNKPGRLTAEEFTIVKRHVVDGALILRGTPETPALAPIVAFEHHLKQDLSGYPENIGTRRLNLCTMIVSIADVYDALRSNRAYRTAMPSDRVRAIMNQQDSPTFEPVLLRRFVNLIGLFPPGTLVRLATDEVAVVIREHPADPFRPQVRIVLDRMGHPLPEPELVDTWDHDATASTGHEAVEAVDPATVNLDPLAYL